MARGKKFIKDTIAIPVFKKPKKLSNSATILLERLRSYKDKPTDEELIYYLCGIDDYEELGYIYHLISAQRNIYKKSGKNDDLYRDTATVCTLKREMLRDDKQLCSVIDKYIDWHDKKYRSTLLRFGANNDFNDELDYKEWQKQRRKK